MVPKHDATRGKTRIYADSDYLSNKANGLSLSHNLYSDYSFYKHKTTAPQHDSLTPWSDERIKATLDAYRRQQLAESIFEVILYALFGAMLVLAYLAE